MVPTITTKTLVALIVLLYTSILSLHHANTFMDQYYETLYDSVVSVYREEAQHSSMTTASGNPDKASGTNTAIDGPLLTKTASNTSKSNAHQNSDVKPSPSTSHNDENEFDVDRRAIVIISTGEKAANMSMVERFIWSARNIGEYRGWIVLITDANKYRYEDLAVAAPPKKQEETRRDNVDVNTKNKFLVFRPSENKFSKITKHRRFTQSLDMNSKIFKTYILQYADIDSRLDSIELFYYLDVDIVFGNRVQPFFEGLERLYEIGRSEVVPHGISSNIGIQNNSENESITSTDRQKESAKIFFFEGNGNNKIQGGQIVLDRNSSQPCLERWRELMLGRRKRRNLKDQMFLTRMLKEQKQRSKEKTATTSIVATQNTTEKPEKKRPDCEIILMKQKSEWIQFPELKDIEDRTAKMQQSDAKRPSYPTLVHFRNSAKVMKHVEEEQLQMYMRDLLGFDQDEKDKLGILNKMIMGKVKK